MNNIIFYTFYLIIFIVMFIISFSSKYPLLEALMHSFLFALGLLTIHKISDKINKK